MEGEKGMKNTQTELAEIEFQGYVLRATRNYHKYELERMGIRLSEDPFGDALDEAIRCFELVHEVSRERR